MKKFYYTTGGALICNEPIEGITQKLDEDAVIFYKGRYFIGESMMKEAARKIAKLLGGELKEL